MLLNVRALVIIIPARNSYNTDLLQLQHRAPEYTPTPTLAQAIPAPPKPSEPITPRLGSHV